LGVARREEVLEPVRSLADGQFAPPHNYPESTMSYFLPHLPSGWHVDEAIKSEEDRVVVIRFGHDWDSQCMVMDETLHSVAEKVQNFAVIYLCDITEVPDFNKVHPVVLSSS
jgi:thiol-disulfide isomerase/thioredoxin